MTAVLQRRLPEVIQRFFLTTIYNYSGEDGSILNALQTWQYLARLPMGGNCLISDVSRIDSRALRSLVNLQDRLEIPIRVRFPGREETGFSSALAEGDFTPMAHYDADGDCVEFIATNETFRAERIDSLVTVYIGRESNEVVGSLIKGVSSFIKGAVERFPGFKIEIEHGRVKLEHLFTLRLWESDQDPDGTAVLVYRKLRDVAERHHFETEFDISKLAA
jgi:hypothetical protein